MIAYLSSILSSQIYVLLKVYLILDLACNVFVTAKIKVSQIQHFSTEINMSSSGGSNSTQMQHSMFNESKNIFCSKNSEKLNNDALLLSKGLMFYCQKKPKFYLGRGVLLTFLLRLKVCQLATDQPWFDEECAKPLYSLTAYHKTSYDSVCNPTKYEMYCQVTENKQNKLLSTIITSLIHRHNITMQASNKTEHFGKINIGNTTANLNRSKKLICQSIESYFDVLYEQVFRNDFVNFTENSFVPFYNVQYTEWFFTFRVICENAACGVSAKDYAKLSIRFLDCVSELCQIVTVVVMVFDAALILITVGANFLILIIFFRTSIMNNIPGYFKLSLALADLGVGIIIMPTVIYNRYRKTYTPLPYRNDTMRLRLHNYFSQSYLQVLIFFGLLFVFVSLYTLCVASVDRYLAITRPFKYEKRKYFTKKSTAVILLLVWLVGAAWAVVPLFIDSPYGSLGDDLVVAKGYSFLLLYGLFLGIPLIVVWVFNIALLSNVRSQYQKRATSNGKRINTLRWYNLDRTNRNVIFVQTSKNAETENSADNSELQASNSLTIKSRYVPVAVDSHRKPKRNQKV